MRQRTPSDDRLRQSDHLLVKRLSFIQHLQTAKTWSKIQPFSSIKTNNKKRLPFYQHHENEGKVSQPLRHHSGLIPNPQRQFPSDIRLRSPSKRDDLHLQTCRLVLGQRDLS
jgi:hypothetical protein